MKKKLLICSLSVMLLVVGVLVAQGVTQKQTEGQGSTENLLNNANEISKVTEVVLTEEIVVTCSSQSWSSDNIKKCATELKSEGKQVAYIVCNEKVISVIGYRENE